MFLISQSVHTLEYEVEESLQVFRTWTRNKNIRITMGECSSNSKTKSGGFSSSSCSSQSNGRRESFLGDSIDKGEDSLSLVESLCKFNELPNGFCVNERFFQIGELRLFFRLPGFILQGFDVLTTRDGQNVEFIIEDKAIIARAQREYEPFVEPCNDLIMSRSPVSRMDVLRDKSTTLSGGSGRIYRPLSWYTVAEGKP